MSNPRIRTAGPVPVHGGGLRAAAARQGIPLDRWLDLSTGINPVPYPVPAVGNDAWHRLPEPDDRLSEAAGDCYGATGRVLPCAGSQAAIQGLPLLRRSCRVGVLHPSYGEHAYAWARAGHEVVALTDEADMDRALPGLDALVLVHPNNPTGALYERDRLLAWRRALAARGGWLVVDEAFMDAAPEHSLASDTHLPGLIVLRSLGKFFGMAGARVGFAIGPEQIVQGLERLLGPWAVAGPSRDAATCALNDHRWQQAARRRLPADSRQLATVLDKSGLRPAGGTALFQWVRSADADLIQENLAARGILVRRFDEPRSLRFGLPGTASEWDRLGQALKETMERAGG